MGHVIHLSMLDVAVELLWPDGMMNHTCLEDVEVLPPTSRSFRVPPTSDGHLALTTLTRRQWDALVLAVLGREPVGTGEMAERMARGGAICARSGRPWPR